VQSSAESSDVLDLEQPPEAFTGSAVEWVLRKADQSLDEIEDNPPEYVKKIYEVSNGPIGARELFSTVLAAFCS
jgi:hypothetical protein